MEKIKVTYKNSKDKWSERFIVTLSPDGQVTDVQFDSDLLSIIAKLKPVEVEEFKQLAHAASPSEY